MCNWERILSNGDLKCFLVGKPSHTCSGRLFYVILWSWLLAWSKHERRVSSSAGTYPISGVGGKFVMYMFQVLQGRVEIRVEFVKAKLASWRLLKCAVLRTQM